MEFFTIWSNNYKKESLPFKLLSDNFLGIHSKNIPELSFRNSSRNTTKTYYMTKSITYLISSMIQKMALSSFTDSKLRIMKSVRRTILFLKIRVRSAKLCYSSNNRQRKKLLRRLDKFYWQVKIFLKLSIFLPAVPQDI